MDIQPTVFHITHRKAGSQWVAEILKQCAPSRFVTPKEFAGHFYDTPIKSGSIYAAVYAAKHDFDAVINLGSFPHKKFVVIRDLRDTLISEYFSLKYSHPLIHERYRKWREILMGCDKTQGLLYIMDEILPEYADFQRSWIDTDAWLIKYEDLIRDEFKIFEKIIEHCQIAISQQRLSDIVCNNSFEVVTGRRRGQEDLIAHQRKGIIGDWQNHFSDLVTEEFKERFGKILIKTGYETDLKWGGDACISFKLNCDFFDNQADEKHDLLISHLSELAEHRFQLVCQQKEELRAKEMLIHSQQSELSAKEKLIHKQQSELIAREEIIQTLLIFQRSSLHYWCVHRPKIFLKRVLPISIQERIRRIRRIFQPKLGQFHQYQPIPVSIPKQYRVLLTSTRPTASVISIVTPSFNHAQFLEHTLKSVLSQDYPNLEYIVRDGGSTDGSVHTLKQYQNQLTHVGPVRTAVSACH